ncbi:MAG TPA: glycosyltransferase family 2 protein [Desulfobacterales bacterium]|nr:glycosyltransferase family 2 protein [Desulfobacterales bacterium]
MQKENHQILISAAIITLNEADRLTDCLTSIRTFVQDIVVVDSGSTDETINIAKNLGARIFKKEWRGFGPQKQFAIEQCRGQWIIILDADERVPAETAAEITRITQSPGTFEAYSIARKNYFMGRWLKHAGWWPDRTVRLFRKGCGRMPERQVHESLKVKGQVANLQNPIIHYPFRDVRHMMEKMNQYSSAGARELRKSGHKSSITKACSRAVWAILFNYFLRGGFLDGGPGLVIAVSDATNIFFKYAKLLEMNKK